MSILQPTLHKPVPLNKKVRFPKDFGNCLNSKEYVLGKVVGIASLHVVFTYIILLDEPMDTPEGIVSAVVVPGSLLESEDGQENWRLT